MVAKKQSNKGKVVKMPNVPDEQPIIEVSQENVKSALKRLQTARSKLMATLYDMHDEYNKKYFEGRLSTPIITIEKMDNRTLGSYTYDEDAMGLRNHIRLNQNFVALNTPERILETLRHEMIHQWQDEALYATTHALPGTVKVPICEKVGDDTYTWNGEWREIEKKFFPKNRHNRDFKEMALVVGIPAIGPKCFGNPAEMPEAKSYNRKFACGCIASNGYPLTIWSTRNVHAKCLNCGKPFKEVPKGGKLIRAKASQIEKPGEDAVQMEMSKHFKGFERFKTKVERDEVTDTMAAGKFETGAYQRNHNAYKDGYRYWVAYAEDAKPAKKKASKTTAKKKTNGDGKAMAKTMKELSLDNPQDIIDLYNKVGTIKKVAQHLGVSASTVQRRITDYGIDLMLGTYWDTPGKGGPLN